MDLTKQRKIKSFWNWFALEARHLADMLARSATDDIVKSVAPRVKSLDDRVGWEIGPGVRKKNAFSVSLNGSIGNLAIAETIIEAAPDLPAWEFNAGRPPKQWDGRFNLHNAKGDAISLDALQWRYLLTASDNGAFFDIAILAHLPAMDGKAKAQAAGIAIQSVVGERTYLERFDRVEFLDRPTPESLDRSTPLLLLNDHMNHLDSMQYGKS
jgi:hypothetical protein